MKYFLFHFFFPLFASVNIYFWFKLFKQISLRYRGGITILPQLPPSFKKKTVIFFLDNFKTILYITFGIQNTYDKTQIYFKPCN